MLQLPTPSPAFETVEATVYSIVQWLRLLIEAIGSAVIALGAVVAVWQLARRTSRPHEQGFGSVRLTLARFLALALEFQLGADILSTAIAPSWEQIGKLGAIAVIRTGLNYFLGKEMETELRKVEHRFDRDAAGATG